MLASLCSPALAEPSAVKNLSPNASNQGKPLKLVPLSEIVRQKPPLPALTPKAGQEEGGPNQAKPAPKPAASGRFIEVKELSPVGDADTPNDDALEPVVDPNTVAADAHFVPTALANVTLRGIHKLTGRTEELVSNIGDEVRFGELKVVIHKCSSVMDQGERGYAALLEVLSDNNASGSEIAVFRGWLFSTTPSLSSIGHAQYDLILISCEA